MSERDDEIRRMEQRRTRAQQRREQALKQRNRMLCTIAGIVVVILFIIVFAISCSRSKNTEVASEAVTTVAQTTTAVETTTAPQTTTAPETTTAALASKMEATDDGINVREKPNTSAGIIKQLDKGEEVNILSDEGEWYKVDVEGRVGYVSKEFLKASSDSDEETTSVSDEETTTADEELDTMDEAE